MSNNESPEVKKTKVVICTPCFTGTMSSAMAGKLGMYLYKLGKFNPEIEVEWWIINRRFVHSARNQFVDAAMHFNFDYIWWVDDDCVIPDNTDLLPRLIAHNKDIVITPYFMRSDNHVCGILRCKDKLRCVADYYNLKLSDLNKGLIEVDGGGTHCMLTKVSMYKELPKPYFALPEFGGTEDMYMCLKARQVGIKIYCDSDIEAGHIGYPPMITSQQCREKENENRDN